MLVSASLPVPVMGVRSADYALIRVTRGSTQCAWSWYFRSAVLTTEGRDKRKMAAYNRTSEAGASGRHFGNQLGAQKS